jgi:hypothetical protein
MAKRLPHQEEARHTVWVRLGRFELTLSLHWRIGDARTRFGF